MDFSAVVLAGGQGSRMGGLDKGIVQYRDKKMIQWTLDVVRPLVSQLLISCNRNLTDYMPLADSVVCDRIAGSLGPLAGIHAAMESTASATLLVLPCDTPLITRSIVEKILLASAENPEAIIVLAEGEFLHPLHAAIPVALKQSLEDYLIDGGRAVRKWYYQHCVIELQITAEESGGLVNINTAAELQ
ncbi:MAG: molybdenum cofactor guanylyltransferase [Pseudomonadales bacterium]|nr:molybdenum cofactor guanylyltransferase [Pseudomonadales bacterium]NRA16426.1 molybdenum cofactor guanylyltransferase [Oceanospirillaceae bacterium]